MAEFLHKAWAQRKKDEVKDHPAVLSESDSTREIADEPKTDEEQPE